MKSSSNLYTLRSRSSEVTSGICFIGDLESNFCLVIRCPIHVYVAIKKSLGPLSIPLKFYSGSVTISMVADSRYHGVFKYRDASGKLKKYNAAFIYPLSLDFDLTDSDVSYILNLVSWFDSFGYQYFDKRDYSIKSLVSRYEKVFDSDVTSFCSDFESTV